MAGPASAQFLFPDVLIVPGKKIGSMALGSLADIYEFLGRHDFDKGQRHWSPETVGINGAAGIYWTSIGFVAAICIRPPQDLVGLILLSYEGVPFNPREFRTAEGIGVGSSMDEVRQAFGPPSSMNQRILDPLDAIRWWYDRNGILFDFVDKRVFSLGVYLPRLCGLGHE